MSTAQETSLVERKRQQIRAKLDTLTTPGLVNTVGMICDTYDDEQHPITPEARIIRAMALDLIEEREGGEAVDALMDRHGL